MSQGKVMKDLELKIRILEREKNRMAIQAEESQLFSRITDILIGRENISSIIEESIEQIALLKKLPFGCLCKVEGDKLLSLFTYPKPEDGNKSSVNLQIGKKIKKEISDAARVYKLSDTKSIKIKYAAVKKETPLTYVLFIPFKSRLIPEGYFVFGDNKKSNRLSSISKLLSQIVSLLSEKIDKLILLSEMTGKKERDTGLTKAAFNEGLNSKVNYLEENNKEGNKIHSILEGTPYLFFYTQDTNANITYISNSVESITGHSVEKWYNQTHWFVTDNKINEYAKERTRAHLRGEYSSGSTLLEVQHAGNYSILLEIFESPIILNGKVVGLQGVAHDITEHKKAVDALEESEEIFSQFMANSPYYVFFKDSNMRSLKLSRNYETMLGRPLNELLNKNMDELFPSDLAKKMINDDLEIFHGGKQVDIEEELNGRFYSTIKFPIYLNNEPKYLAGYTIDITERKLQEKMLVSQNNYMKALNETTLDLISQLDFNLLLENIVNRALQFFGTSSGFLAIPTADGSQLIEKIKIGIFNSEKELVTINPGEGLAGKVWQSGQPMIIEDYGSWPGKRAGNRLDKAGSIMAVPLLAGSTIIGVLGLAYERISETIYDKEILEKLNLFARFATIAIENAKLFSNANKELNDRILAEELLHKQNDYLKAIQESALDLISQTDLDDLLESIVNRAGQLIGASSGFLSLPSPDGSHLICKIETDFIERVKSESIIYPGQGLAGKVWQTGEPIIIEDYSKWSEKRTGPGIKFTGSSIAVPLYSGNSIVGVLGFANESSSNKYFNQESLEKLAMFTQFAVIAIENAKLFSEANNELRERKLAEEALRESENKFKTMFSQSPIGIELYSADGTQIDANKASLDMFGIPDFSEVESFNIFNGTSLSDEIKTRLRNGEPVSYQAAFDFDKVNKLKQYKTNKTGISYLDYTITPISGAQKNSKLGYLLHVQDITERKFAEKEINMLAHSLKSIHECVSITDTENKLIFVNQSFLKTYGFTEEELIGNDINIVSSPNNPPEIFDEILKSTLRGGWFGETINRRKDGSEFPVSLSTSIIKDKNGAVLGLIGVAMDITERKQAEKEINILAHSLRSINECVSISDTENKLVYVNESFQNTFGYTREELIGKNVGLIVSASNPMDTEEEVLKATINGGWKGELINRKKDGSEFPISLSTSVIKDKSGRILGLVGVTTDITERKKAEDAVKKSNEELLTLNRIITESANQLDSKVLLQTALNEALQICGLEGGTVCIITPDQRLHLAVERNTSEATKRDLIENKISIGECLCGTCALEQKPLILNSKNEVMKYATREVQRGEDIRFHAAFPIVTKGVSIGVLCVFTYTDKKPAERSLKLIETMTSQIALTLENANLYEQVHKQLVDLEEEISERKFYEDNLRKNEKNLSITLNSIGDAVISTDDDGCIVRMNPVAEKLCGWSYEDARGRHLSEVFKIINEKTRQPIPTPVKLVMETGKIIGMANHTVLISKDGSEYQISDSAAPIINEEGKILGVVLVFSDVTEKYAIQEALRESEATLVKAELFGKFGNWELNIATQTITASKGAIEIYGVNFEKGGLHAVQSLVMPEYRAYLNESLEKLIQENAPYDVEYKIHRKDGKIVDIHSSARLNQERKIVFGVIQDITERKQAEAKLKESEERYKRITDGLTDYLITVKVENGKAVETIHNEACLAVTGYSQEDFKSDPYLWIKMVLPEDQDAVGMRFFNILQGKDFTPIEHRIVCKNGAVKWISDATIPKYDLNGNLIAYDGVIKDITERKNAEEQLRNSEKEYRNLFEHASDSILIIDPENGAVLEVNSKACIVYGYTKEEFIKKNLMDISDNIQNDMQFIRNIISGLKINNYESLHYKKDGTLIYGLISASVIEYKGRMAIQSFIVDITERKRAEQEIISQRNNFEQLFKNSPIAIAIMDQYDHVIHLNQSFTNLFGYTIEDAMGYDLNDLVVPDHQKEEGVLLSSRAHYGTPISKESFRKKKDGTLVFVQIAGIPIEIDEKRIGIYAMYIDLTHRMKAEQEIIKSKEIAEQSNKMKSEFLAQISHEIRSPINIITSNISLINEDLKDKINPDSQDCFNSIYFATKRIIRTIDLILNMSELQTGSYKPILTAIDIDSKVLQLLYSEFQKPAKDKGIILSYRNEIQMARIIADEYSITQIFANLIDNAVKYTKKGSVEINLTKNAAGNVMVEIKDTGIGINKDFLPRLFEPFIQEEQGYTRSFEGNGLGLSLVKKYCEINNASIEYESEKNIGSTFRIIFNKENALN